MTRSSFIQHHKLAPRNLKSRTLCGLFLCALGASPGWAQSAEDLRMTVGKGVVIDYPSDIRQISMSNPEVVDASPVTTREILMHGKGLGSATMVVWSKTGQRTFYNVTVDLNLDPLRRLLKDSFPNEDIRVATSRDAIVAERTRILERYSRPRPGSGRIVLESGGQQSAIGASHGGQADPATRQVRRARPPKGSAVWREPARGRRRQQCARSVGRAIRRTIVHRHRDRSAGLRRSVSSGATSSTPGSSATGSSNSTTSTASNLTTTISQALNIFAFDPKLNIGAFIQALESENILQVLAQPNLVTTNGKEAEFLVGGSFPVPILQGGASAGAVTVQFKEFGIKLRFTPNVTDHSTIKLHLNQEVSTLDPSHGVTLNGFFIPALSSRTTGTDVELGEGQTFVVAGLLSDQDTYSLSKVPFLSSLPILGNLFKSKTENKQKTELILLVTPEITEPLGPNDPKPSLYFPKDFLVHLEAKDIPPTAKSSKKNN